MRAICPTLDLVENEDRRFFSLFFPIPILVFRIMDSLRFHFHLPKTNQSPAFVLKNKTVNSQKPKRLIFNKGFLLVIIFAKNCAHRHLLTLRLNRMMAVFSVSVLLEILRADDWFEF